MMVGMRQEMKRFLLSLLALAAFSFLPNSAHAVACYAACVDYTECDPGCRTCWGTCLACADLTTEFECTDFGSGAADACFWTGTDCQDLAAVPEIPVESRPFVLFGLVLVAAYFSRRYLPSTR